MHTFLLDLADFRGDLTSSSSESLLSDDDEEDEDELDDDAAARFDFDDASAAALATGDFLEALPTGDFLVSRSTENSFMAAFVRKEEAIDLACSCEEEQFVR